MAFAWERVHLIPDMYLFQTGSEASVNAANGWLGDRLLFGSGDAFRPIGPFIGDALAPGFKDAVLDRFVHDDAARLPGLGQPG